MPAASQAYPWQLVLINGWPIDCTKSEVHHLDSEVTEFPVETGSTISDNIRLLPLRVDLECIVSNTPFGEAAQNVNTQFGVPEDEADFAQPLNALRSNVAYERLLMIRKAREPITIRTSRGKFENMWPKTISIPRDNQTGDAIVFSVNFQQIEYITNTRGARVAIPIATGGGKKKPRVQTVTVVQASTQTLAHAFQRSGNAWFDPDIDGWRKFWIYNKDISKYQYIKGPLLDGKTGSDLELRQYIKGEYKFTETADGRLTPQAVQIAKEQSTGNSAFPRTNSAGLDYVTADPTIVAPPVQDRGFGNSLLDD